MNLWYRRPLLLATLALATLLSGCGRADEPAAAAFNSVDITGASYANAFALPDIDGRQRTLTEFKGKVVVVFFGYTQCPDVCPTTMAELARIKQELGPDGARVQGVFVTVDPERDTPEILRAYMASFDPSFVALRGTLEQTQGLAKAFKVFFAKVPGPTPGTYTIDHTAGSYVFDEQGRVRLFTRYGSASDGLLADLRRLLATG